MRVNEVINNVVLTSAGSGEATPCTGRNLMLHASVRGAGAVSASVKAQGSNTPDVEQSWVDIGLSATASGNTQATAGAEGSCEFAYVRQVLTTMSGVEVVSSISSK